MQESLEQKAAVSSEALLFLNGRSLSRPPPQGSHPHINSPLDGRVFLSGAKPAQSKAHTLRSPNRWHQRALLAWSSPPPPSITGVARYRRRRAQMSLFISLVPDWPGSLGAEFAPGGASAGGSRSASPPEMETPLPAGASLLEPDDPRPALPRCAQVRRGARSGGRAPDAYLGQR